MGAQCTAGSYRSATATFTRRLSRFWPCGAPHMAFRGGTGACAHTRARTFSFLDGDVVSRVRLCYRRSTVLMQLSAVGVVTQRERRAWSARGCGGASRWVFALALTLTLCFCARLVRWGDVTVGSRQSISQCRLWLQIVARSRSCLRLHFCCAFGGCRVFGFAGTRKRSHA